MARRSKDGRWRWIGDGDGRETKGALYNSLEWIAAIVCLVKRINSHNVPVRPMWLLSAV